MHHLLGCLPCFAAGGCRVEVTGRTEEQTGERDEHEGLEDLPSLVDPTNETVGIRTVPPQPAYIPYRCTHPEDKHPYLYHIYERVCIARELTRYNHGHRQSCHQHIPPMLAQGTPALVHNHTYPVQSAPDNEVPTCTVPQAADEHREERVEVRRQQFACRTAEQCAVATQRDIYIALQPA